MKRWVQKKWYKDYIWYYKIIIAALTFGFLAYGFYMDIFKEFWYMSPGFNKPNISLQNYDILLSFYSVQVNIITIIWLILAVFNHHHEQKSWLFSTNFKLTVLNWNLLMLGIFWVGIITGYQNGELTLSDYTKAQISCTIVTHFILPLLFLAYSILTFGDHRFSWKKEYLKRDWWIAISYPLFYLFYTIVRGAIWTRDGHTYMAYPYPFMDINNPLISGLSPGQTATLIAVGFFAIFSGIQAGLQAFNNGMYRVFEKYKDQTLWYEKITAKIKLFVQKKFPPKSKDKGVKTDEKE